MHVMPITPNKLAKTRAPTKSSEVPPKKSLRNQKNSAETIERAANMSDMHPRRTQSEKRGLGRTLNSRSSVGFSIVLV
jgi:hypothetical protein